MWPSFIHYKLLIVNLFIVVSGYLFVQVCGSYFSIDWKKLILIHSLFYFMTYHVFIFNIIWQRCPNCGATSLVYILRGSKNQRVKPHWMKLSTYGAGKDRNEAFWKELSKWCCCVYVYRVLLFLLLPCISSHSLHCFDNAPFNI